MQVNNLSTSVTFGRSRTLLLAALVGASLAGQSPKVTSVKAQDKGPAKAAVAPTPRQLTPFNEIRALMTREQKSFMTQIFRDEKLEPTSLKWVHKDSSIFKGDWEFKKSPDSDSMDGYITLLSNGSVSVLFLKPAPGITSRVYNVTSEGTATRTTVYPSGLPGIAPRQDRTSYMLRKSKF